MDLSISFKTSTKMSSIKHNNRDLTEKEWQEPAHHHIMREHSEDNIYLKQENLKDAYNNLFGEALRDYNNKQKRKDRKINDFYHHVKKSKTLDLQREFIVSLGTKTDWDNLPRQEKLQAGKKLAEYIQEFEERHPHLYIYNAVVHLDELGAPHAHFNVVPVASGYKNGLKLKPSFKKALANEGYKDNGRMLLKQFKDDEVKALEQKLKELGYERKFVGTNDIKDMHEYKNIISQTKEEITRINSKTSESLLELSKAKDDINTLEKYSEALESKIKGLEDELLKTEQKKAAFDDLEVLSENELDSIKSKKTLLRKEYVELSKEQFEKLKDLIYRSRHEAHQKEIELNNLRLQAPFKQKQYSVQASLERAKSKIKGEDVETLLQENQALKQEVSVLRQENTKMRDRLERLLKPKEWQQFLKELSNIKPIVSAIKTIAKTVERGLSL